MLYRIGLLILRFLRNKKTENYTENIFDSLVIFFLYAMRPRFLNFFIKQGVKIISIESQNY